MFKKTFFSSSLMTQINKLDCESSQLMSICAVKALAQMLMVLPTNIREGCECLSAKKFYNLVLCFWLKLEPLFGA
jgi:hypothetical protein